MHGRELPTAEIHNVTCIAWQRRDKHLPAEARDKNTLSLLGNDSVQMFQQPRNNWSCVLFDYLLDYAAILRTWDFFSVWSVSRLYNEFSEAVKCGHQSRGSRTWEWLCWRGPAAIVKYRPILSSQRMLRKDYENKYLVGENMLVVSLKGFVAKTNWLA
jgi:hypothetical protein